LIIINSFLEARFENIFSSSIDVFKFVCSLKAFGGKL